MNKFSSRRITRNVFSISIGQTFSLIINFFSIILAARYLGVENFGEFSFLLALVGILSKIIDSGIAPIVFRESSKEFGEFQLLNNALLLRAIILIIVVSLFNIVGFLIHLPFNEIILSDLLFISVIISSKFQNFRDLLEIPFKVDLKMYLPMIFNVVDNISFLVFVLLMPYLKIKLNTFIIGSVLTNLPGFLLLLFTLKKTYRFNFTINTAKLYWLIKEALPLSGFVILSVFFNQSDLIFLKIFKDSYAVGIFSAATRLALPLYIFPTAIVSTVFPIIVKNIKNNARQNSLISSLVYKILFIASFLIAVLFTFKAEAIIGIVFGKQYIESSLPLTILLWAQIFLFLNYFTVDLLTAYNKQILNLYYAIIIVIINSLLDIILIPHLSFLAPTIAKIISGLIGFVFLFYSIGKLKLNLKMNYKNFLLPVIIIGAVIYLFSLFSMFIYFIFSFFTFLLFLFLFKFFNAEEVIILKKLLPVRIGSSKFISFLINHL